MNTPREHLIAQVSDMYKDLYGCRPLFDYDWPAMDEDDLREAIAELREEYRQWKSQ